MAKFPSHLYLYLSLNNLRADQNTAPVYREKSTLEEKKGRDGERERRLATYTVALSVRGRSKPVAAGVTDVDLFSSLPKRLPCATHPLIFRTILYLYARFHEKYS